ncbi:cupin domain-containing protein [Bacillus sp. JCM 19034]|uniref:cupin domain-containing protein n=1 Tax=Bacillus sp. JCM 19034 TaxID=1481928 RepID=UPI0007833AC7|nr:AraC family ligand binding domain-containing protein [Bacillus sp. JCM 19034]
MYDEVKYKIDHHFSIQYMYQTGYSEMPRPHSHPTYELFYIYKGGKRFFINDTVYLGQKGDLIFVQPNDIHRTSNSQQLECERMLINVSDEFIKDELERIPAALADYSRSLFRFRFMNSRSSKRFYKEYIENVNGSSLAMRHVFVLV